MLKFPQKHTEDEKANGIIARFLNGNILGLVKDEIADYEYKCRAGRGSVVAHPCRIYEWHGAGHGML